MPRTKKKKTLKEKFSIQLTNLAKFHRSLIKRFQQKTNITNYQMLWIFFAKGILIGLFLL